METIKNLIQHFFIVKKEREEDIESRRASRRARIFQEDNLVCTKDNRENCYDPTSIRDAFRPLGIFAKIFGLFPRYDLSFVEKLEDKRIKVIHILDYCYSALILAVISGGAIMCTLYPPTLIVRMTDYKEKNLTDYYVHMAIVYLTMATGVMSLFIFPSAGSELVTFLHHLINLDKILRFDGRMEERGFGRRILVYMIVIFCGSLLSFYALYVMEVEKDEPEELCFTDYILPPILAVSGAALLIPSGLVLFFLHAIRLRLFHFNKVIKELLSPSIPSCFLCVSYSDYGKELDEKSCSSGEKPTDGAYNGGLDFAKDLEKLRILHSELRSLSKELGCIFGTHLTRDFLFSILGLILYTFILIYMSHGTVTNWIIYIVLDFFLILKLIVLAESAQRISCFGVQSKNILHKVSLLRITADSQLQVQMFLSALENPITISASGYFIIDRRLITSIVGAITTYFIILIQFKVGDVKQELQSLNLLCSNSTL